MSDAVRDRIREGRPIYFDGERVTSVERYNALLAGDVDEAPEDSLDDLVDSESEHLRELEPLEDFEPADEAE